MTDFVPPGFEFVEAVSNYDRAFGPLYQNLAERKLAFRVAENHLNPKGVCHGGALATFADMQIRVARNTLALEAHRPTVNLSVDYIGPAKLGAWVEAEIFLVKATRALVFTRAVITADGEVIGNSRAIYHTPLPRR
jgi:uncharacterized protein (TIGR00369 family)